MIYLIFAIASLIRIDNVKHQNAYNRRSNTFDVHNLQLAGLVNSRADGDMRLFMREEAKTLWNELQSLTANSIAIIQGCPGVGKSVLVFAFVMHYCRKNSKTLLYYHSDSSYSRCLVLNGDGSMDSVQDVNIPDYIAKNKCNYDVTVIDGTHEIEDIKKVHQNFPLDKQLIICTSYQSLRLNQEAMTKDMERRIFLDVTSWTLVDYMQAAKANCFSFLNNVVEEERNDIVTTRFRISGGSIRLFILDPGEAIKAIDRSLNSVNDYNLVYRNQVGDRSESAVNGIMALYRSNSGKIYSIPLSKYVFDRLGELCKKKNDIIDFILKARSSLPNNPSWQGWVTEYEVISILKLYGQLVIHDGTNKKKTLSCTEIIEMGENEAYKRCHYYGVNNWIT